MLTREQLIRNLEPPRGRVDVILDTDTFNEADDQYALSYLLLSGAKLNTVGICAAPFLNANSTSPADGMEKSYREILKLLGLLHREDLIPAVMRGACDYLPDEKTPVVTDASEFMVREARKHSPENPLYIVSIAAATNVASAILTDPVAMTENVVHVWLGGHALHWVDTNEFNMRQDVAAARILFGCGAPLVQLPCCGVVTGFATTKPELEHWLSGKNPLCDYLVRIAVDDVESRHKGIAWDRTIWDVTAVGWLLNENDRMMLSYLRPAAIPQYDNTYSEQPTRHPMRYVYFIKRYDLMTDLFLKLAGAGQ